MRNYSLLYSYHFFTFNNFLTQRVIPYVLSRFEKRGEGVYTDCDIYNGEALSYIDALSRSKRLHVAYVHFFTPHIYPLVVGEPESERIANANRWIQQSIRVINNNDPKAGVVIFSDHGLRAPDIRQKLWNSNLLYFRYVAMDTSLVNRNGLVNHVESIKY